MEHWKVLSATMLGRQETFLKSRHTRMAKTVPFWPWWQPFNNFCFETLSFFPLFPSFFLLYKKVCICVCVCGAMRCGGFSNSSVIRQKGEPQNGCFKKTKHAKFSEKRKCAYQGIKMFVFRKIWRALFSWNTHFEIRPFALLLTIYCSKLILLLKLFNVLDEKYYLRGLFIWWLIHKITLWSCCSYSLIYYLITKINSFYNKLFNRVLMYFFDFDCRKFYRYLGRKILLSNKITKQVFYSQFD